MKTNKVDDTTSKITLEINKRVEYGVKKRMEKMEDLMRLNLEKLEKLDDELSERLFGNYNLLKMKMVFNVSIFFRSFWINNDSKKFLFC